MANSRGAITQIIITAAGFAIGFGIVVPLVKQRLIQKGILSENV